MLKSQPPIFHKYSYGMQAKANHANAQNLKYELADRIGEPAPCGGSPRCGEWRRKDEAARMRRFPTPRRLPSQRVVV